MIKQKRALAEEDTQRKQKQTRVGGKLMRREKSRGEGELMVSLSEVWSKEWGLLKTLLARFLILICTLCIFSVLFYLPLPAKGSSNIFLGESEAHLSGKQKLKSFANLLGDKIRGLYLFQIQRKNTTAFN